MELLSVGFAAYPRTAGRVLCVADALSVDDAGADLIPDGGERAANAAAAARFAVLRAEVERLDGEPVSTAATTLAAELVSLRAVLNRGELLFASLASAFDRAADPHRSCLEYDDSVTTVHWIRHHCHMTVAATSAALMVGEERPALAAAEAALQAGRIGYGHLALIASIQRAAVDAGRVRSLDPGEPAVIFDEDRVLALAEEHSVSRFRHDCASLRHALDAEAYLSEQVRAVEFRRLELSRCGQGGLRIEGILDSAGGATLQAALEPLAIRENRADERSRSKRLADALVELAGRCLDDGKVPARATQRPHLQVTVPLDTMLALRGAPAAEMEYSEPIAAETVRRFACDATITRVLLDAESAVLDVGRSKRVVTGAQRTALNVRDRGCRWPGCERTASSTQAHHLQHWLNGGATASDNLVLLCHRHHWMVHEGGWRLEGTVAAPVVLGPVPRWEVRPRVAEQPQWDEPIRQDERPPWEDQAPWEEQAAGALAGQRRESTELPLPDW